MIQVHRSHRAVCTTVAIATVIATVVNPLLLLCQGECSYIAFVVACIGTAVGVDVRACEG